MASPLDTAVTNPLLTVTIPSGDTLHTTGWVQLSGVTVAVNWADNLSSAVAPALCIFLFI